MQAVNLDEQGYNGWKNRQTWNVWLWITNDEPLYRAACAYAERRKKAGARPTYRGFIKSIGMQGERTPDDVAYISTRLDYIRLTESLGELID
jgi:hypothetical protein